MRPIDVASLFGVRCPERDDADAAIMRAACGLGFMTIVGFAAMDPPAAGVHDGLLRVFGLPDAVKRRLCRQKFVAGNRNVYRGWFPLSGGGATYKEGIDLGSDLARPDMVAADDPLREATPLPDEAELPGWRAEAAAYYCSMERIGDALLRALARGLGLSEHAFASLFEGGISTLRLLHYPVRPAEILADLPEDLFVERGGRRLAVSGKAHVDSGFVTLLAQTGVEGLQARDHAGCWIDIPPAEGTLVVNFGKLLDRWTGGRIKATEHRVLGTGRARYSLPFFYEPRVDARIAPLPGLGERFAPFDYGDHLWQSMTKFVEFAGMETLRPSQKASA